MKIPFSPRSILVPAAAAALISLSSGCVIDQRDQQMRMQQQHEESLIMQEDLRRLRGRLEAMEQDLMRLSQQVNSIGAEQTRVNQSQFQAINASLDDLQQQIRRVDTAREKDKKEIVDALSARITALMSAQSTSRGASRSGRSISNEGYEHTVQPGETISAIAKAYQVRADDIVQANNLKSADMLRVGQKLFIPAP